MAVITVTLLCVFTLLPFTISITPQPTEAANNNKEQNVNKFSQIQFNTAITLLPQDLQTVARRLLLLQLPRTLISHS